MSALAHPLRLELLELLGSEGPLTATAAGQRLGQSPGNMSWHLRVLARYGFVTEAEEGVGRRRPWKLSRTAVGVDADPTTEPERAAADALISAVVERAFGQLRAWLAGRHTASAAWWSASTVGYRSMYLTADETARLREDIFALLEPFRARDGHPLRRPEGAVPVNVLLTMNPQVTPGAGVQS
jgi:DNA-binding transcriptional ArsR family regulator